MMKFQSKILTLTAALLLLLTAVSCGSAASDSSQTDTAPESVSSAESLEPAETALETLTKSDDFRQQVSTLSESYEAQGMKLTITAEGNTLIYTCTYTVEGVATDEVKAGLADHLASEEMTASMLEILHEMQQTYPETESVRVRYVDMDGTELITKEYR